MADGVDLEAVERHIEPLRGCDKCKTREMAAELRIARRTIERIHQLVDAAEFLIRNDTTTSPQYVMAGLIADILGVLPEHNQGARV